MIEIDPYSTPAALLKSVSRETAERHGVFPISMDSEVIVLCAGQPKSIEEIEELARDVGRRVVVRIVDAADVQFAIRRAYNKEWVPVPMERRIGQRLLRQGAVDTLTLQKALEQQKHTNQLLGQILIELKAITETNVKDVLKGD